MLTCVLRRCAQCSYRAADHPKRQYSNRLGPQYCNRDSKIPSFQRSKTLGGQRLEDSKMLQFQDSKILRF